MKKIFSLFLSFVIVFTMCFAYTGTVYAEGIDFGSGITGTFDADTATLTVSCNTEGAEMLDFDSSKTYENIDNIKTIKVESKVGKIGAFAFYNCANLENIYVYNNSCKISENALPDNNEITVYGQTGSLAVGFARTNGYVVGKLYSVAFFSYTGETLSVELYPEDTSLSEIPQPEFSTVITPPKTTSIDGVYRHKSSVGIWKITPTPSGDTLTSSLVYTEADKSEACTFEDTEVPANCMSGSYVHHECEVCGFTYDDTPSDELGEHRYKEIEGTRIEPTCQSQGSVQVECEICSDAKTEILPKVDHSYTGSVVSNNNGTHSVECVYECGETTDEGCSYVRDLIKAPTKLEEGEMKYTCFKCGYFYTESIEKVDCDHTGETKTENAKDATCTENGFTGDTYCKDCGTLIKSGTVIGYKGHNYIKVSDEIDAKCTENGKTAVMRCENCNDEIGREVIPAKGHIFGTDGNAEKCTVCGAKNPSYVQPTTSDPSLKLTTSTTLPNITIPSMPTTTEVSPGSTNSVVDVTQPVATTPSTQATDPTQSNPSTESSTAYPTTTYSQQPTSNVNTTTAAVKKPSKTSISKLTKGNKSFKVAWKKVSAVSGYQIQYSTSKKFTKKTTKTVTVSGNKSKSPSKTIKKLKAKKKYYVRVRTYKTVKVNGKSTKVYSSWSKVKSVKTK